MSQNAPQIQQKTISVELTLHEAMALTGVRYSLNPMHELNAMRKIKQGLEEQILEPNELQ